MRSFFSMAVAALIAALPLPDALSATTAMSALHIPDVFAYEELRIIYRCAGDVRLPVRYLNTNAGALAYLRAGGKKRLFVSVMAASGVKYVSDRYVWWTKGDEAFLEDVTRDEEPLVKDCRQVEQW